MGDDAGIMQYNQQTLKTLSQCFLQTLAQNPEPRKQAENFLKQAADQSGYGMVIMQVVCERTVDEQVRQAAAVNFKNHIKFRWETTDADSPSSVVPIQDAEKEQIKGAILNPMLSTPPKIQSQLSEALAIMSQHDFPRKWQTLLPELVKELSTATDYSVINGILQTANSIFKRFRSVYKSNELLMDLKYCLDGFNVPLTEIFQKTGIIIAANPEAPAVLNPTLECQRLCCRIFYSLNFQDLSEFFEDHIAEWMGEFHKYLTYINPLLVECDPAKTSIVDEVKAAVCENINLYMEKNEQEFMPFLSQFATDVWSLLTTVSLAPIQDRLAITAIKFLTTVSKSVHHKLFADPATLTLICKSIVTPNVKIRAEDEELFEMSHVEYIRRGVEGSDLDTREGCARKKRSVGAGAGAGAGGGAAEEMSNKRRRNVTLVPDDQESGIFKKARKTSSSGTSGTSVKGGATALSIIEASPCSPSRQGLTDDILLELFHLLNQRDRAGLALVCKAWRALLSAPSLWSSLDLRAHRLDSETASALASRCSQLKSLKFRGSANASSIVKLEALELRELTGDCCSSISDAALSMVVARHGNLESLQIGSDCERVTSEVLKVVALCCPKLRRLCISGISDVDRESGQQLFQHCKELAELSLLESFTIDERALAAATSLRFLSVAGCRGVVWTTAALCWSKLPNLVGLDVSRTEITPSALTHLLAAPELKVVCALHCPSLEDDSNPKPSLSSKTVLLSQFTDLNEGMEALSRPRNSRGAFSSGRTSTSPLDVEVVEWTEWILSHALLKIAESNSPSLDSFWLKQGTAMMLRLVQSVREDVQERAATALATFVVVDDENATVDSARAEAVMNGGGIALLLGLAKSSREGVQSEAAKAIANLSVNTEVAKRVALEGGISILAALARSPNRWVAEEAAGGLWNLSVGEEHKAAIARAGAIEALVDLAFKWTSSGGEGVLERAAGALANLAADDKCSMEVATAGGVRALVMLARSCSHEGVQEQAARALANLAAHGDSNGNNAAVGREQGALEALVHLTCSNHEGVRQEAAGALWNLSFDDRNREAIAAAGGVEALVALAQGCSSGSQGLQERAAGALWGLSVSEANSIAIGREGGVAPLIKLAHSDFEDVHETAVGALWNLAFNPGNALRMVNEQGVPALVHLCSSSKSKMARFMAALALAYMFDGRTDEVVSGLSNNGEPKSWTHAHLNAGRRLALRDIEAFVQTFSDQQALTAAASSWAPATLNLVAEAARIQEAGHLRCSGAEIGRFVAMLRNGAEVLRACAAFALLQFTMPGGRHALHHVILLQNTGASRVLRIVAAAATASLQAKVFARIVLRNLELHQAESNAVVALS